VIGTIFKSNFTRGHFLEAKRIIKEESEGEGVNMIHKE
jgi:hypothetical protein